MGKTVDESTLVVLEWWDGVTGMWAQAGEFDTREEAEARAAELDLENLASYLAAGERAVWRTVTTIVEAVRPRWKCERRGFHTTGALYVSRTRDGWEYGTVEDGELFRVGETSRPIARAKELAEREVV